MAKLEKELEEALGDVDFDELQEGLSLNSGSTGDNEDTDEEEIRPKLKNWQLKKVHEHEPDVKQPVHIKQTRWSMQKRLKKVHVETLERVYSRTKRPTVRKFIL